MSAETAVLFLLLAGGGLYLYSKQAQAAAANPVNLTAADLTQYGVTPIDTTATDPTAAYLASIGIGPSFTPADTVDATAAIQGAMLGAGLGVINFSSALNGGAQVTAGKMAVQDVYNLAASQISTYGFNVAADMAAAIAIVESGDVSNPSTGCNPAATRYEAKLGVSSDGLMQVLSTTAAWLNSIGYTAYAPTGLADPATGMYYGLAYLDWLTKRGGGENAVVQGYNAGPGNASAPYLAKYIRAKSWVDAMSIA